MRVPVILIRQGLVDAVIEVLVVGENNMAPDIVELGEARSALRRWNGTGRLTKPSGVTSVEARPPGVSFESMIIHDGPFWECQHLRLARSRWGRPSHDLIQALRRPETRGTGADDENIDIARIRYQS